MSDAVDGEPEGRVEDSIERRPSDIGNGSAGGKRDLGDAGQQQASKRDSDAASSGSEGSQRTASGGQLQLAHQGQQPQGMSTKIQGQSSEDNSGGEQMPDKNQVKRHVEASPQGRYLRFEDKLGTGQYKVVYRSYDTSMGIEVAWNTVNIKNLPKDEKKRIMNEVRLLQNLEHKNLVQFHGSWVNREREEVIFVTEIMQSGSLMDFIRKVEMIRWRVVKRWARQILRGMHYLHSQDPPIIHRDLKCDNIFINGAAGDIRIGDLGLSTSNTRSEKTMSVLGTPEFMAPELYEEFYTEKVDIYAFGMCMLEMVTKERPYSECVNAAQIYRKVTSQIPPSALDRVQNVRAREFIRVCLSPDPDERPSAMDLLNLPFLKDKNEDEDNTLVMLDPPVVEGLGQILDTAAAAAAGVSLGMGVNAPAKIDPTLPGVSHPAQKGTPGLDTIEEAVVVAAVHRPPPTTTPLQGQLSASPTSARSRGDGGSSAPSDTEGSGDMAARRPSYAMALMSDSGGSEVWEVGNEGSEVGNQEQAGEFKGGDVSAPPGASGGKGDSGDVHGVDGAEEVQQYGAHKIPGNPPFVSDDDEDEQEHDMSHPEGFLRAMPEDESAMRVLKLPDGRVQRVEDDDDEEAAREEESTDDEDTVPVAQSAPSSAQSPPLSSGSAPTSSDAIPAVADGPGLAAPAPFGLAPRPPTTEASSFLSGDHRTVALAATDSSSAITAGPSTPGTISPSGIVIATMGIPGTSFSAIASSNHPSSAPMTNAMPAASMVSCPGFVSPSVGPPVGLQRARSFSPVDHVPETMNMVAPPPMAQAPNVPAPSFPAPTPPVEQHAKVHGIQPLDAQGTGNGPGSSQPMAYEGERSASVAQADQELQELLSGRPVGLGGLPTEVKIANLQGPEQEVMRLVMHTHIEGRLQEVEFDFNLDDDHPEQVSAEMIRELGLSDEELGPISLTITNLAEKARRRRMRRTSSTSSVAVSQQNDVNAVAVNLPWNGSDTNIAGGAHRGSQGSGGTASFGSGGGEAAVSGGSEGADNDHALGSLAGGVEEVWSDDDLDIEEDDEFRKRKLLHDKKKRQAEKVYEARLAALLAARNDRTDEHNRAKERYKKDCDDFDKKVEKLQSEKERRMEECLDELRGLEDGYRQKHRDAKQAKRHNAAAMQAGMLSVAQPPLEAAPTPQGYAQRHSIGHVPVPVQNQGQGSSDGAGQQGHGQGQQMMDSSRPRNADGDQGGDDMGGSAEQQPITLSQFNSNDGGGGSLWNSNTHAHEAAAAAPSSAQQGTNPPTSEEEDLARRDRLSTL